MSRCRWFNPIMQFVADESGPTAVEYAVMLAMILMAAIATISAVGGGSGNLWENNANEISNAVNGS